jgi:hypothetical protein
MTLYVFTAIVLIFFFICLVNYEFQKYKYKYATKEVMKKLSILESPNTWIICTFISGFILLVGVVFAIGNMAGGFSNMQNTQNMINQYQNSISTQNDSTNQSANRGQAN